MLLIITTAIIKQTNTNNRAGRAAARALVHGARVDRVEGGDPLRGVHEDRPLRREAQPSLFRRHHAQAGGSVRHAASTAPGAPLPLQRKTGELANTIADLHLDVVFGSAAESDPTLTVSSHNSRFIKGGCSGNRV